MQQEQTERTIDFRDYVREGLAKLSPEQRREAIARYVQLGIYVDTPELWQIIGEQEPLVIWRAVNRFGEPLTAQMLDALERMLLKITGPAGWRDISIRVAAHLYRYNRPAGRAYLERILKNHANAEAAVVFAMNREERLLKSIFNALFQGIASDSDASRAVTEALADWRHPAVAAALLKALQQDSQHVYYSVALANQGVAAAVPLIREQYRTTRSHGPGRIHLAAALIKLKAAESKQLMNYILGQLRSPTSEVNRVAAIHVFGRVRERKAVPVLQEMVRRYIQTKPPFKPRTPEENSIRPPEDLQAISCAKSLARIKDTSVRGLIARLLVRFKENGEEPSLWVPVARALLDLDASHRDSVAALRSVMGETWLARERKLRALKPLPDYLLLDEKFDPASPGPLL